MASILSAKKQEGYPFVGGCAHRDIIILKHADKIVELPAYDQNTPGITTKEAGRFLEIEYIQYYRVTFQCGNRKIDFYKLKGLTDLEASAMFFDWFTETLVPDKDK